MVTVAKSLDAPIKLLAPKPSSTTASGIDFAMLGLGDVVIPGLMIALCLRFDLQRYASKRLLAEKSKKDKDGSVIGKDTKNRGDLVDISPRHPFPRPYFWTGIVSYLIGLGTTMWVMHTFKRAQPALLYLSPACCTFCLYSSPSCHALALFWRVFWC